MTDRKRFDDVLEGDELGPVDWFLSKAQVREYARVNGIAFPRFVDDAGARAEGLPGMIAPGNMSMGLITRLVESWAGRGTLRRLGTTFRGLVLPDRTLRLHGAVTVKHDAERLVDIDVWIESDDGERLVVGTASVTLA
jgi:acyl dehydratase